MVPSRSIEHSRTSPQCTSCTAQRPLDGIEVVRLAAAVDEDAGMLRLDLRVVDRHRHALVAESPRRLAHEAGRSSTSRVHRRPCPRRRGAAVHVVERRTPPPAVNGMKTSSDMRSMISTTRRARLARHDVEEDQLVDAVGIVHLRRRHRIARLALVLVEAHAFEQPPATQQELRDDALLEHRGPVATDSSAGNSSSARCPLSWLFSGWNWVATDVVRATIAVTGRRTARADHVAPVAWQRMWKLCTK